VTPEKLILRSTVPPNTTAQVILPATSADAIAESGKPLSGNRNVRVVSSHRGACVLAVESGDYRFEVKRSPRNQAGSGLK
jgi:alpha-L-rhamnosidase